ncbi:MAG: ribonuclease H family protein [Microthrixaceae bacterium]
MPRREPTPVPPGATVVYTDGACRGNPGPGGWAWAVPGGAWASGADPATTNQRMEISAAFEAVRSLDGPVHVVSDSTYVVNCFRDEWWKGWRQRGWKNSKKEPVANRDLWEPFIELVLERGDVTFDWVKGHGGDPMNDLVDRLAVAAAHVQHGASGGEPPTAEELGPADRPRRSAASAVRSLAADGSELPEEPERPAVRDGRIPSGAPCAVVGVRSESLASSAQGERLRRHLGQILAAKAELEPDLVVLTGLRAGAEQAGAMAAAAAGVPYAVVLPYPDPTAGWTDAARSEFERTCAAAVTVVTLERTRPPDAAGKRAALSRRDGWLRSVSTSAIVVTDGVEGEADLLLRKFTAALGDEVWQVELDELR